MKFIKPCIFAVFLMLPFADSMAQDQQAEIDSLVTLLKGAGREWNDYAIPLIAIGEPAVPALIEVARDRSLSGWTRRISIMTLNDIHSPLWVEPALGILLDRTEDPTTRNQVTAGLRGFDLSEKKDDLWRLYEEARNEFHKSNLAHLMVQADTAMAYNAFVELYSENNAWVQRSALINLVQIRPHEFTQWFLKGLQADDCPCIIKPARGRRSVGVLYTYLARGVSRNWFLCSLRHSRTIAGWCIPKPRSPWVVWNRMRWCRILSHSGRIPEAGCGTMPGG